MAVDGSCTHPHLRRRHVSERIRHSTSRMASAAARICDRAARVTPRYPSAERRRRLYSGVQQRVKSATERTRKIAQVDFPSSVILLALTVLLPLVTFIAAFKTTSRVWQDEIWKKKGYFLSAAIDMPPAQCFAALGLTTSLFSFVAVAYVRHKIVSMRLHKRRMLIHRISLALAIVAAFGGNGVTAYPHHTSRVMHNGFAALCVLGALLHFSLEALIEWVEPLVSRATRLWHTALCLAAASCCSIFVLHIVVEEIGNRSVGIGKLAAAIAEIATMSCFMLYLSSYLNSFRHARVSMSITFAYDQQRPQHGSDLGPSDAAEEASLSGGYTEAVEEWILQQLS
ncbi:hypothetical protein AB1Y20_009479 [Prymnesium parvum]|uniref:CWH43-like N-terminal domain-containing protein n=1 Tax=Prymnesium parvum TaxID=97485 RepID=A0AB34K6L4_PRYPA